MRRRSFLISSLVAIALTSAACGGGGGGSKEEAKSESKGQVKAEQVTLRLGYFPNVTHAAAVAGVESGLIQEKLGDNITLEPKTFNAGPAAVEALFAEAIDATYIGPNPAINAFAKSKGEAIRIIAGATSGGAALVVKPEINKAADLKGKKIASPQLGNTQDVALRSWLLEQGFKTELTGAGDVGVVPQENAQTLEQFKSGAIQGAWLPEPWATRLVQEAGAKVLVNEADLWPGGKFVTTHLIVRTKFAQEHPEAVEKLLKAHLAATDFVNDNPAEAQTLVNTGIEKLTGKALPAELIAAAWKNLTFTYDPIATSLYEGAEAAKAVGLLDPATVIDGIYDVAPLNKILKAAGKTAVSVPASDDKAK